MIVAGDVECWFGLCVDSGLGMYGCVEGNEGCGAQSRKKMDRRLNCPRVFRLFGFSVDSGSLSL